MVASLVAKSRPDFTIHLGDVYFVGDGTEVKENFLGEKTSGYTPSEMADGHEGELCADRKSRNVRARQRIFRVRAAENGIEGRRQRMGPGPMGEFFLPAERTLAHPGDRYGLQLGGIRLGASAQSSRRPSSSGRRCISSPSARFRPR